MPIPMEYLGCGALGVITLALVLRFLSARDQYVRLRSEDIEDIGRVVEIALSHSLDPLREHVENTSNAIAVICARLQITVPRDTDRPRGPSNGAA